MPKNLLAYSPKNFREFLHATRPRCTKILVVAIYIPHGVASFALLMFCIVATNRNPRVAALAQGHEISIVVRTPVCKRTDVMHFLSRRQPAFALTLLAQRMRLNITRANPSPYTTVTLAGAMIALVFVVLMFCNLLVLLAVPTIGQFAAPRIGTRALGFSRHWRSSLSGIRKALRDFSHKARVYTFYTAILPDSHITSTLIYSHLFEPD